MGMNLDADSRVLIADVTRRVVATSSPSVAPTAPDVPPRTRPSRDSPSVTWLSRPPFVCCTSHPPFSDSDQEGDFVAVRAKWAGDMGPQERGGFKGLINIRR